MSNFFTVEAVAVYLTIVVAAAVVYFALAQQYRFKVEEQACHPYRVIKNIDSSGNWTVQPGERVFCADGVIRLTNPPK